MEAVIFAGLQGAGKSTFYQERFFATHLCISLDMLKTRHRERRFLQTCLETRQPFVVDNTNPTRAERQVYIEAARQAGFRVIGYYFQSKIEGCKRRNEIAAQCITRHHAHHYLGFAETQWKLFQKENPPRVKPLLYVYRVLLTGIHLMQTGVSRRT